MMTPIRTRFAPSPTGFMHVGGIRTALFAYLTAKQAGGSFVLRLEDTDKNREVEGSAEHIMECLRALGLEWDEGIDKGGEFAPYRQSERLNTYKEWAQKLIDAGRAYADPYTSEEVQAFREEAQKNKKAFLYRDHRPENPPAWDGSQPLRFKSNPKPYQWHDEVYGDLSTGPEVIDDFILIKSDGYPTYNFAHIVDDAEMEITHVLRGQEFLSSQPNYMNLYEAFGFDMSSAAEEKHLSAESLTPSPAMPETHDSDETMLNSQRNSQRQLPTFATMPHIMNEQGNKKLGKRDGAKDLLDYIREGYLPETMLSFIATLGWNDGTEQEVFTKDELIEKFDLSRVQRSGARFDEKRLLWMNGQFIRRLNPENLETVAGPYWSDTARNADPVYRQQVLLLAQDRLKTLRDLPVLTSYFFEEPVTDWSLIDSNKQLKKIEMADRSAYLQQTVEALENTDWNEASIQETLNALLETTGQKPGILFSLIRIVTTWAPFSPELPKTLELLGKDRVIARIRAAL